MISYRDLLQNVEVLTCGDPITGQQRAEFRHYLGICEEDFTNLLSTKLPAAEDRAQLISREVRLPNAAPTLLDEQDAQIALKLSEDYKLNELDCVSLLMATHQELNILGRDPREILRLTAGVWFTERQALLKALLLLLKVVVLDDDGLDADFVVELRAYVERLLDSGVRGRMLMLLKELNRESPSGLGAPGCEPFVMDPRGTLVARSEVVQRQRMLLSQALLYSCLISRMDSSEAKEIFLQLKDCAVDWSASKDPVKLKIAYTMMFALVVALVSDSLSGAEDAVLSSDAAFCADFHKQVMVATAAPSTADSFTSVVRLAWFAFVSNGGGALLADQAREVLNRALQQKAFGFISQTILKSSTFQNDDPDLAYICNVYMHKVLSTFLSNDIGQDKLKELKDAAVRAPNPESAEPGAVAGASAGLQIPPQAEPFVSLLEFIGAIYQRDPELMADNHELSSFIIAAGEDHRGIWTLVPFLNLLTALATGEDGARQVNNFMQTPKLVSWKTLLDSLVALDGLFQADLQSTGLLREFTPTDAKGLEAYLQLLRKVMLEGSEAERTYWFPQIEPLFKLLQYDNVPPRVKGALRNAIVTFVPVSSAMRDMVWALMAKYDLPISAQPAATDGTTPVQQAYDMGYELTEVEVRQEEYPSTLSYMELVNSLIATEMRPADQGRRYGVYFKFVREQVFGPFAQRGYSDPAEKWKLVVASLTHFESMLSMYTLRPEDFEAGDHEMGGIRKAGGGRPDDPPGLEILKNFMTGGGIYWNVLSILMMGVEMALDERTNEVYGVVLEEAIRLCLSLFVLVFAFDTTLADILRPTHQTVDVILSYDSRQVIALLEYIRYSVNPAIQQSSIRIASILSARIPQLVSVIVAAGSAKRLIEDYADCLEARAESANAPEIAEEDSGALILQLLLANLDRPAPNLTHLLLRFDMDQPVERTVLLPKLEYSCLRVVLELLLKLQRPDVNARLHEFGFQLLYELCTDPVTSQAVVDLLRAPKYEFFSKHLEEMAGEPLPKRSVSQPLRISNLHQRAWLVKLAALALHVADADMAPHRDICRKLLARLFHQEPLFGDVLLLTDGTRTGIAPGHEGQRKNKVLELLDCLQFQLPDITAALGKEVQGARGDLRVEELLEDPSFVEAGGVYHLSERGDRLIDINALRDALWEEYKSVESKYNLATNGQRQAELREAVQQTLRWAWKKNKFLEEQAAQLHLGIAWSQLVEVVVSRRFELMSTASRLQILYEMLNASLTAIVSPDCSLKMSFSLSQAVMTLMAKLRQQSGAASAGGDDTDDVTYVDLINQARLPTQQCLALLSKLVMAIVRPDSSEGLRQRLYSTLLIYLNYCRGVVTRDLPLDILRALMLDGQEDMIEDSDISKLDRQQAALTHGNFAILKQEATQLVNVLARDAMNAGEARKALAFYVLEALVALDQQPVFLGQLQSRGLLQTCLVDIGRNSYKALVLPSDESARRVYTLEAQLALLLRAGVHTRAGAQALFSMEALRYMSGCQIIDTVHSYDGHGDIGDSFATWSMTSPRERLHRILVPVLRIVLCATTLIDTSVATGKGDDVTSAAVEFVNAHEGVIARILRDDSLKAPRLATLTELHLTTSILAKVWALETVRGDSPQITELLFNLMYSFFTADSESANKYIRSITEVNRASDVAPHIREGVRSLELGVAGVRGNLISFLHDLVTRAGFICHCSPGGLGGMEVRAKRGAARPTLQLVCELLMQSTIDLMAALEEKASLLTKLRDVNELSRHEVDEIIKVYGRRELPAGGLGNIRERRHLALMEMTSAAGLRDRQVVLLLDISEHALEILYIHFKGMAAAGQEPVGTREEMSLLGQKMLPILDRLQSLTEERLGRSAQHVQRLLQVLKSYALMDASFGA